MQPRQAARTTKSGSRKGHAEDAFTLLEEDHKRVQKLFKQFEKLDPDDEEACRELVETACEELEIHTTIEEEIFYPALREALEKADILDEAEVEHDSAKVLIEQLRSLEPSDPKYAATFTVLGEYVNHHIEEEESEMFKQAKKAKVDVDALGQQMLTRRGELEEELDGDGADDEVEGAAATTNRSVR